MKSFSLYLAATAFALIAGASAEAQSVPGLTQTVYDNIPSYDYYPTDMTIAEEEAFTATATPDSTSIFLADPQSFSYGATEGYQATNFSGSLNIVTAGLYTFTLYADDAAQLRVDGAVIAESTFYGGGVSAPNSVTLDLSAGAHAYDLFYFQTLGGQYLSSGFSNIETGANFTSVLPVAPGAVPEPATWAMMMLGCSVIGFGLRRRAQAVRITYA